MFSIYNITDPYHLVYCIYDTTARKLIHISKSRKSPDVNKRAFRSGVAVLIGREQMNYKKVRLEYLLFFDSE